MRRSQLLACLLDGRNYIFIQSLNNLPLPEAQPNILSQKNSIILNSLKNSALAPLPSSTISMLLPKTCFEFSVYCRAAEYSENGPVLPIKTSCAVVEESIRGLILPGCGTGYLTIAVRELGVENVRYWVVVVMLERLEQLGCMFCGRQFRQLLLTAAVTLNVHNLSGSRMLYEAKPGVIEESNGTTKRVSCNGNLSLPTARPPRPVSPGMSTVNG